MTPIVHFTRRYRLSASHRLHAPSLTDQQNADAYGKCNNVFGHGHSYRIEITVAGPVDLNTGFVVDMAALDALAQRELIDRFDTNYLNTDPTFAHAYVPSTEHLAYEIDRVFQAALPSIDPHGHLRLAGIRIEETSNNSFELPARQPGVHPLA